MRNQALTTRQGLWTMTTLTCLATTVACGSGAAPELSGLTDQVAQVGTELKIDLQGSDPDGDQLNYRFRAPDLEEVADHAIALAMALCRQLMPLDQEAKQLGWNIKVGPKLRRLSMLTFGIVGLGRIGTATALRAKALGFRVIFHDPYLPNGADKAVGIARVRTLDELLTQTDVLSLHCPLNDETRHLIAERELSLLKSGAFVVNTARGAIIKKSAILAALYDERLGGAGLDVIEDEPLRSEEEAATPNLIATCHAAFCSVESKIEMRSTSARIALAAVTGQPLENVVNGVV